MSFGRKIMDKQDEINAKLLTLIENQRGINDNLSYLRRDLKTIKDILMVFFIFFLIGLFVIVMQSL